MENKNININEMSSEDLGLLIIDLFNQANQVNANILAVRNLLIDRKPKTEIVQPQENNNGPNSGKSV
jgi:hypothetical protein